MKKLFPISAIFILLTIFVISCGEETDVVESGTYTGTIDEVNADEVEIYVKTQDGKTLELYFTENTQILNSGLPAEFSELKKGQKVEVKVEKKGKRLDPLKVNIMKDE